MRRRSLLWLALATAAMLPLAGCGSSSSSGGSSTGGAGTPSDPQALFAGSDACQTCHQEIYANFVNSGHPYKLNKVVNDQMPTYPFSTINGGLEMIDNNGAPTDNTLGTPTSYADISYVIGGYGWKARWIDADGYIVTGAQVQYNLEDGSMVAYHAGSVDLPYNCGNCHTTGWRHYDASLNPNRQDGLPGMDGTFVAGGVQCESCHGPGKTHISTQKAGDIVEVAKARTTSELLAPDAAYGKAVTCGECHTRDGERDYPDYVSAYNKDFPTGPKVGGRIDASGGLGKHHQQYDEMLGIDPATGKALGKHGAVLTCITCHDPHKTIKYADQAGDSGLVKVCDDCHGAGEAFEVTMPSDSYMGDFDCEECHMPKLAKSAIKHDAEGTGPATGDISTHIFKIDLTKTEQVTSDGKYVNPWITKSYACGTCHNGEEAYDISALDVTGYTFHKASSVGDLAGQVEGKYAGSEVCAECHETNYNNFKQSGHPFKLNKVKNATVPTYPFSDIGPGLALMADDDDAGGAVSSANPTDNSLGTPTSYADVSYVIGGYGWKARWIDADGYIVTGAAVQYNLNGTADDDLMVAYHNDSVDVPYNCGNCHTTGWQHYDDTMNPNRQDGLPGMDGTFVLEGGVHCESCHGAALEHVVTRDSDDITEIATQRTTADLLAGTAWNAPVTCGECHTRDGEHDYPTYVSPFEVDAGKTDFLGGRIDASGGFGKHHQQYDELLGVDPDDIASGGIGEHLQAGITCISCHSPHATTKYQDDPNNTSSGPGVENDCDVCHTVTFSVVQHESQECEGCHMAKAAKSAIKTDGALGADTFGDIRSHVFKIDLTKDSDTEQFTADGKFMYPWLAPNFACGTCHADPAGQVADLSADHGGVVHISVSTSVPGTVYVNP